MIEEIPEEVVWRYNGRAHIENHIKELKGGFGRDQLPSGDFATNAVYFAIGVMVCNLFLVQRLLMMPADYWQTKTIKSIRWGLVEAAGGLITHGWQLILTLAAGVEKYRLYCEMRRCTALLQSA